MKCIKEWDEKYLILFILIFTLSYVQMPLYTSNQNTYLLHGVKDAGINFLQNDWQANTTDPFPLFTFLIAATIKYGAPAVIYIYQSVMVSIYIASILGIMIRANLIDKEKKILALFIFVIFTFVHSNIFELYSLKHGYSMLFQGGVASQYILGNIFQPSVFGVLILVSIYFFLSEKTYISILLLGFASIFHSTYILSDAVLTFTYMVVIYIRERNLQQAISIGFFSLLLVLYPLINYYLNFAPTSPEIASIAQNILINYRIPHHTIPSYWFGKDTIVKIALVTTALFLIRKNSLFPILFISYFSAFSLTLIQIITKSNFLALLFPWRLSVYLVPLSSMIIICYACNYIYKKTEKTKLINVIRVGSIALLLIMPIAGINQTHHYFSQAGTIEKTELVNYIISNKGEDDIYLIPIEWENFRLSTNAPIFVDRKSHPYKDTEIIEWYRRIKLAGEFYSYDYVEDVEYLKNEGITHIITSKPNSINNTELIYGNNKWYIYKII